MGVGRTLMSEEGGLRHDRRGLQEGFIFLSALEPEVEQTSEDSYPRFVASLMFFPVAFTDIASQN